MKQPLGIRLLSWFAWIFSAGMFSSIALAILDIGPHLMGGESDSHGMAAYRRAARCNDRLPDGFVAYGLATRKAWSRDLVMAIFVLIIVYASALDALNVLRHTIMLRAIANASVACCVSAWYFYFKPNVAEYFRKLGGQ